MAASMTDCRTGAMGRRGDGRTPRVAPPAVDLTIAMPVYNERATVEQAIASVLDAGFTEETFEIIDRFQPIGTPPSRQHGADLEIRGDRHHTLGIGFQSPGEGGSRSLAEKHRHDGRRIDNDHAASSPLAPSHSALLTGRVS